MPKQPGRPIGSRTNDDEKHMARIAQLVKFQSVDPRHAMETVYLATCDQWIHVQKQSVKRRWREEWRRNANQYLDRAEDPSNKLTPEKFGDFVYMLAKSALVVQLALERVSVRLAQRAKEDPEFPLLLKALANSNPTPDAPSHNP